MKDYKADLHIHTCLSPCAAHDMRPAQIVRAARTVGLDIIGISDHNSGENVEAVMKAAERENLVVLAGMEITSREEVHILGILEDLEALMRLQELVYADLPGENDEKAFGRQVLANEHDETVGAVDRLLIGATRLALEKVIGSIHACGGLAIAAHVDREGFSITGQLGFIPEHLPLDAVEVSSRSRANMCSGYPVISSSDAHFLNDIGRSMTTFLIDGPTFLEIAKALLGKDGRKASVA